MRCARSHSWWLSVFLDVTKRTRSLYWGRMDHNILSRPAVWWGIWAGPCFVHLDLGPLLKPSSRPGPPPPAYMFYHHHASSSLPGSSSDLHPDSVLPLNPQRHIIRCRLEDSLGSCLDIPEGSKAPRQGPAKHFVCSHLHKSALLSLRENLLNTEEKFFIMHIWFFSALLRYIDK